MKESSFSSIKNSLKENRLFSVVYLCNSRAQGREPISTFLCFCNIAVNLIRFLSIREIGIVSSDILSLGLIVNAVLLSLMFLIIAELLMCMLYQIEFYISIQWKFYRFLALPLLMTFLLKESVQPEELESAIASILFVVTLVVSLTLTAILAFESCVYKRVLHRNLPINWNLLIIEVLFVGFEVLQQQNLRIVLILIVTILSLMTFNINFAQLQDNSYEMRFLSISTFMMLWYGMVLSLIMMTINGENQYGQNLILASIPCLFYKIGVELTREKSPVPYQEFVSIFEDPDNIDFDKFISSVQPVIEEIMEFYYSEQKKEFSETLLISYYYEHSNRCRNANCPFRFEDYKYELKNMSDSKNMKEVLFRLCKKMDYLFHGMYVTYAENIDLKLSLIQFYILCYPNKAKALEIISEIESTKLNIQQQYELFRIKILTQTMTNLELTGELKVDQRVVEFGNSSADLENLVYLTLNTMMELWSMFSDEKIQFSKLANMTSKIFPLRKKIEEVFESRLNMETFSTLQILKLYSLYSKVVENDDKKSLKINEYLQKLKGKLEQNKQIEYLSFDSQIGLIALSLSENNLGKIAMVNSQASNIFNYSKNEFKSIRVNDIMPVTYSNQHDNYLKNFLNNRNKKVNSDDRKVYGKGKNNYIFPIHLQLQRTVSSASEELLFVANIRKIKQKTAELICITDEEGEICDLNPTFDYTLIKKDQQKQKSSCLHKNIQEFIPEFFDPHDSENSTNGNSGERHYTQTFDHKVEGTIQVDFKVASISFPKKKNGGFIIEGHITNQSDKICYPHLSMTRSIDTMMNRETLVAHRNFYNSKLNRFELQKQAKPLGINDQFEKMFTIPFINLNDMTNLFGVKKEEVQYGSNVKVIRLVRDHFERVEEPDDFESDCEDERTQEAQTKNQIIELRESLSKDSKPAFLNNIKLALACWSVVCILMGVAIIGSIRDYSEENTAMLNEVKNKFETRAFLAEYIIYFTSSAIGLSSTAVYQERLNSSRVELVNAIELSEIQQSKKQEMLRIIFLQTSANLTELLNQDTIRFTNEKHDAVSAILNYWYLFYVCLFILMAVSISTYFLFLRELEDIYQVFMCLEEKTIKKIYNNCKSIVQRIQINNKTASENENLDQEEAHQESESYDEENENPVKKVRKFKPEQSARNVCLILKIIFPFLIIFGFTIFKVVQMSSNDEHFFEEVEIHQQIFEIVPESSVYFMNTFLKNTQNHISSTEVNFTMAYQDIEEILFNYEYQNPGHIETSYFDTLLSNVCQNSEIATTAQLDTSLCSNISESTMTVGLSKAINFLANSLKSYDLNPSGSNLEERFNELITLEFDFIFPVVDLLANLMFEELSEESESFYTENFTMTVIALIMIGLNLLYFYKYPAVEVEEQVELSKNLIELLPDISEPKPNQKGYEQIKEEE